MESYIQISKINDFLYCPMSLYLHSLYENFNTKTFHQKPQVVGKLNHETIETGTYSASRRFVMGKEVWSEIYNIAGKIDIYDCKEKSLIERKTKIKQIFDGYKYQLYAQYFCITEMGYPVEKLFLHSLEDNKRYSIELPDKNEQKKFEKLLQEIMDFKIEKFTEHSCDKCKESIYGALSW